jgi:hypothetical protein
MNKIFTFLLLSTFAFNVYADEKLDKVLEEIQALNKDLKNWKKQFIAKVLQLNLQDHLKVFQLL